MCQDERAPHQEAAVSFVIGIAIGVAIGLARIVWRERRNKRA
jgi:hypothetical protein